MNFPVVPKRMALINVDMQNCFVENPEREGLALLDRINEFAVICRAAGILVVHIRGIVKADGSNLGVYGEIFPRAREVFSPDARTAALHPRLVIEAGDIVCDKPRFGAFHGTDLEWILRSHGIDSVIISGIATNVCCDTTAREAMQRDFRVFFLSDGTAAKPFGGFSAEEMQKTTLATLGTLFAQVVSLDEMTQKIHAALPVPAQVDTA